RFGLAAALRREVAQRQVHKMNSRGSIGHEGRATVRKCPGKLVGTHALWRTVEIFVIGITDHHSVAILAEESDVMLIPEIHNLFVPAGPDEDGDPPARIVGNEVDSALYGCEVARAVSGHDDAHRVRRRWCRTCAKGPCLRTVESRKTFSPAKSDDAGVDLDIVAPAILQDAGMQCDRHGAVVNDDGVEMEALGESSDNRLLIGGRWCSS